MQPQSMATLGNNMPAEKCCLDWEVENGQQWIKLFWNELQK